jgi:biotin synthase-like enzyme
MTVQTCFEERNLVEYGFIKGDCLNAELAFKLANKVFTKKWNARKGKLCNCVEMIDIGVYNSCKHFCKYCYANFDEKKVNDNYGNHDPNSSLLIGHLKNDDIIKEKI